MNTGSTTTTFRVKDYDLAATLMSGQVFRWDRRDEGWIGVVGARWVHLRSHDCSLAAETVEPVSDWDWLARFLQVDISLNEVLLTFPGDEPMRAAVAACRGLRVLRQDPWECLASFILSSTKQIVQIRQVISLLSRKFGVPLPVPPSYAPAFAFPSPVRLAGATEAELRFCKMGFRAPYLLAVARKVASGKFDLDRLREMPLAVARNELMTLPGVGQKIADCVLLFAYGAQSAFPLDVWVLKALRQLYFPWKRASIQQLRRFATGHFGPNAGYTQQYLFHYVRTKMKMRSPKPKRTSLARVEKK